VTSDEPQSPPAKSYAVWCLTILTAFLWGAFVLVDFINHGFRSGLCGAGFLELPQLCCVTPAWFVVNGVTLIRVLDSNQRRLALVVELLAVAALLAAFAMQSRPLPGCGAYG
jgi:hypothetical protein